MHKNMQQPYSFVTKWQIRAPLEDVWDAIYESTEWPYWWKGVLEVNVLKANNANGIHGIREYTWKSFLPYKLSFAMELVQNEPLKLLSGVAFGELEGNGTWRFYKKDDGVVFVQYNWNIYTTKEWMNTFSFILKPAFKYNHNVLMRWGAKGLAKKLNAELISF